MIKLCAFADEAGNSLDEQIAALKRNNIPYLELRSIDKKNVSSFTEEEAKAYAARLAEAGIRVWSIGSPLGKVDITCDFDEYMKTVRHTVKLAKIFDCTRIRMFSFFHAKEALDEVVRRLQVMVDAAAEEGVYLYHENEKDIYGENAKEVQTLQQRVKGMRYIYDPANFVQCGQDMAYAVKQLPGTIGYYHIKDVIRETGELVPAGEGDGMLPEMVNAITRDATLTIEPHLMTFDAYAQIDNTEMKGKHVYKDNNESFDAACAGIKRVLTEAGYKETEKGWEKKMIKYGIIGVGNMGSSHVKTIISGWAGPDASVAAIADLDDSKIARMKELYPDANIAYYKSGAELIAAGGVDAVIIAVPHYQHTVLAIDAMKHGIAVVCEKPAGVYTKDVKEMNRVSEETGVPFTMMFNQRTNCVYRKMREMVQSGAVGEIKRVNWIITDWYRTQYYYDSGAWRGTWRGEGGGVLLNQCPHQLDLLQWIVGMMPVKLQAHVHFGKWHDIEVEDDVTAYFEYPNGATGVFITTTGDYPGSNRFEIQGTRGQLICDSHRQGYLEYLPLLEDEREYCKTSDQGFGRPQPGEKVEAVETDGLNRQHPAIIENFTNYLLGKEELFVDGKEGLKGVMLMDAMLFSGFTGKMIDLPFDDEEFYREHQKRVATGRVKEDVAGVVLDTAGTYGSK